MTSAVFPEISAPDLPEAALSRPLSGASTRTVSQDPAVDEMRLRDLGELLAPAVSAAIARTTRQRRFTP